MSICAVGFLRRTSSRTSKPDDFRSPAQNPSNSLQCSEVETSSGALLTCRGLVRGAPSRWDRSSRREILLSPQGGQRVPRHCQPSASGQKEGRSKDSREEFVAGAYNHHVPWATLLFGI